MKYGYARVSTVTQASDGNSLEVQEKALKEAGADVIYSDAYTGTTLDRPELDKLRSELKSGDQLIVTKLDRMARSVSQGLEIIQELTDKGVSINILNMGVYDKEAAQGKLMLTIMLAFAEFERSLILERTLEGKAIKRLKGELKEGRPKKDIDMNELKELFIKQQKHMITVKDACNVLNISKTYWYRYSKTFDISL